MSIGFWDTQAGMNAAETIAESLQEIAGHLGKLAEKEGASREKRADPYAEAIEFEPQPEQAKSPLDPKGHLVLAKRDGGYYETLVYMPEVKHCAFVGAHGYDPETGEWAAGDYHESLIDAAASFEPATVTAILGESEMEDALRRHGVDPTMTAKAKLWASTSAWGDDFAADVRSAMMDAARKQLDACIFWLVEEGTLKAVPDQADGTE